MINYNILAGSVRLYQELGFKQIEVPWLVSEAISDITRPPEAKQYVVTKGDKRKAFIASGEQGFLYLMAKRHLTDGRYQTITPCVRNDTFDATHVKYFMKNELIMIGKNLDVSDVLKMTECAMKFFKNFCEPGSLATIHNSTSCDIEYHGVEIGSYGYRECEFGNWVYGTGVAEPRFSTLLRKHKRIED